MKIKAQLDFHNGIKILQRVKYQYDKLNNLPNIQMSNKSQASIKSEYVIIPCYEGCSYRH